MQFWQGGFVVDVLLLAVLFAGWLLVRTSFASLRRAAIPDAIVVGLAGFALGPEGFGALPFDHGPLEVLIYHGLAIVFIAVALQSRLPSRLVSDTRSMAFAMPCMAITQAIFGLCVVFAWSAYSQAAVHPGFGLLLPLGFQQGPGQALSLGSAWEASGLAHGAALGLAFAAMGFLVCAAIGIPGVAWARRRGRGRHNTEAAESKPESSTASASSTPHPTGRLTIQVVIIGTVYALTYGVLLVATQWLPPPHANMAWGLHFVIAAGIALGARRILGRHASITLDDRLLGSIGNLVVDFTTAAALVAVQLQLLGPWIAPFLIATIGGAAATGLMCWFVAPRMFRHRRLEHAVVLFGASTGTLPTGLALLKMIDPHLRGPAAQSIVLATPLAVVLGLPLLVVVMPMALSGWPARGLEGAWTAAGLLLAYLAILGVGWAWAADVLPRRRS